MKLSQLKHQLYLRIRQEVSERSGERDVEIQTSSHAMRRLFRQNWKKSSPQKFQKALQKSHWVFWGDFHGVRQFQRSFINHFKSVTSAGVPRPGIGLECLPSTHQKWIDQFLSGRITETEFLEKVKWSQSWGFPWEHYRPIFEWAKAQGILIWALNSPRKTATLLQREKWALERLRKLSGPVWILYGELHLLPSRFSKLLSRSEKQQSSFVFQNSDELYFRSPPKKDGDVWSLSQNLFCLQNVPPWVKWQTYLLFLEASEDPEVEMELEITEHVLRAARVLAHEFGFQVDEGRLHVYTAEDQALWNQIRQLESAPRGICEAFVESGVSFVNPQGGWAYLSRVSANEVAALAFQVLMFQENPQLRWPDLRTPHVATWAHVVWILGFSYFGSKLMNPHRKTPSLLELQKWAKSRLSPVERQASRLAIRFELRKTLKSEEDPFFQTSSARIRFLALTWLAGMMGEKLFNAYNQGAASAQYLKAFLIKNPALENFHAVEAELEEMFSSF